MSRGTRSILLRIRILAGFTSASRASSASASSSMPLARVDQNADQIGLVRAAPRRRHHGAVEPTLRGEYPRRVDEYKLRLAVDGYAADQRPRRLHLVRDDRDLGADQGVEQRRLARVGRTDQGHETAAGVRSAGHSQINHRVYPPPRRRGSAWRQRPPASAARFEEPSPSAGGRSGSTTATRNSGS